MTSLTSWRFKESSITENADSEHLMFSVNT
ncbi:hypothetical protein FHS42_002486 [Streptomyces zagrosensis]|uniref:Uncharacterized protein n=1 Tax=Streptomyces zagrosensis TaxID=1042984 RepID=A0A7W9Q8Q6_9ACTN|nr:hypothetical protein [Streptomyces zagrosensis]